MSESSGFVWEAVVTADRTQYERHAGDGRSWDFPEGRRPWVIALDQPEIRIGRQTKHTRPEIDLSWPGPLGDPASSRLHAFIQRQHDGSFALVDNGALNGTTINEDRGPIHEYTPVPLGDGDRIHIGAWTTITVRAAPLSYGTTAEAVSTQTERLKRGATDPGSVVAGTEGAAAWLVCATIPDSRLLSERSPDRYPALLEAFRNVLGEACSEYGGVTIASLDDRVALSFLAPRQAIGAAIAIQERLGGGRSETGEVRARVGVHVEPRQGVRVSTGLGFAICFAAHGGQILVSEAARTELGSDVLDGASLIELESVRLTDLLGPQRLYQLVHPSLERDFPPPRSLDTRPHNLPVQLTRFIGRTTEVEDVKRLIRANRLCTVTGPGGGGKTRLALEVAAGVALSLPDGVWLADLSGVSDGALVARQVAGSLGLQEGGSGTYAPLGQGRSETPTDRLVEHLQDRNVLLVLDNCERAVEAVAELVDRLLRGCPTVRVLVTSRQVLGLPGEARYRLGPLDLPSPRWPSSALRQCGSVRLFVDRAMLQNPGLALDDEAVELIAWICERVDGIPFAIELAAAQTKLLAPRQIAEMLEDRLLSLEDTIEWSANLLSEREQLLLYRLSIFVGGFTLEAAQRVCGGEDLESAEILDLLTGLLDKSLVEIKVEPRQNRYRLLEATRQHGARQLEGSEELAWLRAAHVAWFVDFAERAASELTGAEQRRWLDALEEDHENLRAALLAVPRLGTRDDLRLSGSLARFWLVRGLLSEGIAWLDAALYRSDEPADAIRLEALGACSMLACFASDYEHAETLAEEARSLARRLELRGPEANALAVLALVATAQGRLADAEDHNAEALRTAGATSDWWVSAFALTDLGNDLALRGATDDARLRYEEGLALRREHADTWGIVWSLFRLGMLTTWQGRYPEAVSSLEEAFALSQELRFGQGTLVALLGLGEALHVSGSQVPAGQRYAEALRIARDLEDPASACLAIAGLANVALARGDIVEAAKWLTQEETVHADRSPALLAVVQRTRALLSASEGDDVDAEAMHQEAFALRRRLGDRRGMIEDAEYLSLLWARSGPLEGPAMVLAAAETARREMHLPAPTIARAQLEPLVQRIAASSVQSVTADWDVGSSLSIEDALDRAVAERAAGRETGPEPLRSEPGPGATDGRLTEAQRAWIEDLREALLATMAPDRAQELFARYGAAFPLGYWTDADAATAIRDIQRIETADRGLEVQLARPADAPDGFLELRLVHAARPITVSEITPVLENMGLRVLNERAHQIEPVGTSPVWIYEFGLTRTDPVAGEDTSAGGHLFEEAFAQVWAGALDNDALNQLVLGAGMSWRDVALLRAYTRYSSQIRNAFSTGYTEQTLTAYPDVARRLVALFHARFDPDGSARGHETRLIEEIVAAIDPVVSLDEDRILRGLLQLIRATLRTNFFQLEDGQPKDRIALKFDPASVPDLPAPQPAFEIYVCSPRTEGVHLRGGKIARGGIRWSDRLLDYRTEVAGLMKAQTLKNAVIIPVGAKGGFVVKRPPDDPGALPAEVLACYRDFIRGLLDLTDNLVEDRVVAPERVVRYDDDDTYLVVAADKGTATFSDEANAISAEYGFWLGDGFASGGSTGYDHKGIGITARGTWESVRCHFRRLGIDADAEEITVVGIGDMSGDVFGNGALMSEHMKIVGAFDHRHIMLDPDPDPAASYQERERLFRLPRSSWADYGVHVLSAGGGVFPRDAKSVELTPEIQRLLGIEEAVLTPDVLIRALLKTPVDLLFNGGVGTFVKATSESDADVGDKTNDTVRLNAGELRCRVIGEGGNLGLTQRARVEFARAGGMLNSDSIDNSAGVDCSDHEVNIKILLAGAVEAGELSVEERNALLAAMTDDVAALVLRDNRLQNQSLTHNDLWGRSLGPARLLAMQTLELAGHLDRDVDSLPLDPEFNERRASGEDLSVPELGVLLAHSKIALYEELLRSDVAEDPALLGELQQYFPTVLNERYTAHVRNHSLRRAIVANAIANEFFNRAEVTFASRLQSQTDKSPAEIVRAYVVAREILDMRGFWTQVEGLDAPMSTDSRSDLMRRGNETLERVTRWLLRRSSELIDVAASIDRYAEHVATIASALPAVLAPSERARYEEQARALAEEGVSKELIQPVAGARALLAAPDIVDLAIRSGAAVDTVAATYYALGEQLELTWWRDEIVERDPNTEWEMRALTGYEEELLGDHRALAEMVLDSTGAEVDASERVRTWALAHPIAIERWRSFVGRIGEGGLPDIVTLGVAVRELRNLVTEITRSGAGST